MAQRDVYAETVQDHGFDPLEGAGRGDLTEGTER